jgi:hypothetical protein
MTKQYPWLDLSVLENIMKEYGIKPLSWEEIHGTQPQVNNIESVDIKEETEKNESALKSP